MNSHNAHVLPSETVAALVLACVAIDGILEAGYLTPDITEELEYLRPELNRFCLMNKGGAFRA